MTWHVAAISKNSIGNWDLCKEVGLFGISTSGRQHSVGHVAPGDKLVVWISTVGWVACAEILEKPRKPTGKEETPWAGSIYRYGLVLPIKVIFEPKHPVWLKFVDFKQEKTGLSQFSIRRGFSAISDKVGLAALAVMKNEI